MSRERMSAKPVRGGTHLDSSQISKTTCIDKNAVVTVIEQYITVVKDSLENVYLRGYGSFIVKTRAEMTRPKHQ